MKTRISVITPSYNSAKYIEDNIQSLLRQSYPHFEHIIVDGGSTDGTLDVVGNYPHLKVISEPDQGQYDAINKGFRMAEGEILCWLNADDMYFPWTLHVVAEIFQQFSDIHWITSLFPTHANALGNIVHTYAMNGYHSHSLRHPLNPRIKPEAGWIQQESTFWTRSLWEKSGAGLDLQFPYAADFELWFRFSEWEEIVGVNTPLAGFRWLDEQRSYKYRKEYYQDLQLVYGKHLIHSALWFSSVYRYVMSSFNGIPNKIKALFPFSKVVKTLLYDRSTQQWTIKKQRIIPG